MNQDLSLISDVSFLGSSNKVKVQEKLNPNKWTLKFDHRVNLGMILVYQGNINNLVSLNFPSEVEGRVKVKLGNNNTVTKGTLRLSENERKFSLTVGSSQEPLIIPNSGNLTVNFTADININLDGTVEVFPPSIPPNPPQLPLPDIDNIFHPIFLPPPRLIISETTFI